MDFSEQGASYKLFNSLLWDVQRHVIVPTLSYRKITYHSLLRR